MRRSARLCISCCASVLATTNSTPCRFAAIMLSTALVPPPPTPITVMRGVKSVCDLLRDGEVEGHGDFSPSRYESAEVACYDRCIGFADQHQTRSCRKLTRRRNRPARPLGLEVDVLQACGPRRRPRPAGRRRWRRPGRMPNSGRPRNAIGRPSAHLLAEDARRHLAHAGKLAGAAGQHDAVAGGARQARSRPAGPSPSRRSLRGAGG